MSRFTVTTCDNCHEEMREEDWDEDECPFEYDSETDKDFCCWTCWVEHCGGQMRMFA